MSTPVASNILASETWPILHFAIIGIVTESMISCIILMLAVLATPPAFLISYGSLSKTITATAPESSAICACSTLVTSIMTPCFCMRAKPRFIKLVPLTSVGYCEDWSFTPLDSILLSPKDNVIDLISYSTYIDISFDKMINTCCHEIAHYIQLAK